MFKLVIGVTIIGTCSIIISLFSNPNAFASLCPKCFNLKYPWSNSPSLKANNRNQVEEKIIKSIFSKKPKRADVYWFLHINRTEEPFTMNYDVSELVDDKVIKVNINIGFRIQPKTEIYFKKIVQELVSNQELNLHIRPDGSTKYNNEPDFKFVVIEKFLSIENAFALREGLLLQGYFKLKHLGQSDAKAFGLEKSDIIIEQVPMIVSPITNLNLNRLHHLNKQSNWPNRCKSSA